MSVCGKARQGNISKVLGGKPKGAFCVWFGLFSEIRAIIENLGEVARGDTVSSRYIRKHERAYGSRVSSDEGNFF